MAIQFNCSSCNAVLRVGDESAGKSARCPTCQSIQPIPGPSAPTPSDDPFGAFKSEFNEPPQAPSANPYASPVTSHASASVATGGYHPTTTDFGEVFAHSWQAFKRNVGVLVGATVVVGAVSIFFNIVTSILDSAANNNNRMEFALLSLGLSLLGSCVNTFIGIGMARICLATARFQPAELGTLFSGGDKFLAVVGGTILYMIGAIFGILLLILPGMIFMLLLWPYYYFIVDRQCGVFESFSKAFEVGKLNWVTSFVLGIATIVIFIAGALALLVGLLFAAPFIGVMFATTYVMMKGERPGQPGIPQPGAPQAAF